MKRVFTDRSVENEMNFSEFAVMHDLTLEVIRHYSSNYSVCFRGAEIKADGILSGEFGRGPTEERAIYEYIKLISGKILVLNAYDRQLRREIYVPKVLLFNGKLEH